MNLGGHCQIKGSAKSGVLPQGHRSRAPNQGHLWTWLCPSVTIAKSPQIITSRLPDPKLVKNAHPSTRPMAPQPTHNTTLPAGILGLEAIYTGYVALTASSTLPGLLGVGPLCLQHPSYLCSLFLINSLPSEMLCVWKLFSNLRLDSHNINGVGHSL